MPIEVADGIGAAPGFVVWRLNDLGTGCARLRVMFVHILEIDEDAHRCHSAFAGADHAHRFEPWPIMMRWSPSDISACMPPSGGVVRISSLKPATQERDRRAAGEDAEL